LKAGAHRNMVMEYADDLRLFKTPLAKAGLIILLLLYALAPQYLTDYWLKVLGFCGVYAIAAVSLNLLTGYTGQVSLGHAFFIGAGAYTSAYLGAAHQWPLWLYVPAAAAIGFAVGAVVGPFALRLRGNYLVIVTLGLVFIGIHVFSNWRSITGGRGGTSTAAAPVSIGPLDFGKLNLFGQIYTREQGMFWLIWGAVGLSCLIAKNIVRSRPGRAMQAIRDRDISAEIIGVSLARYKIGAFAVSGAMAAAAGALYGPLTFGGLTSTQFDLFLSINFVAMVIIGGVGTVFGGVVGALVVVAGQRLIEQNTNLFLFDPLIQTAPGESGFFSTGQFNALVFGLFIVLFLLFEPRGLAAVWFRVKAYFSAWPFSY
jgi:branched-chain amino acid transport system permease protein